jgi:mannose-6-phosphate isomerase-like protein (cupin superfamily)
MRDQYEVDQLVRRGATAGFSDEYNCKIRRLFPWPDRVNTKRPMTEFGCMLVTLEPGKQVELHDHDEEETFIVISGEAILEVAGKSTTLGSNDVAYIPRLAKHSLRNEGASAFVMLDIYWDLGGSAQEPS